MAARHDARVWLALVTVYLVWGSTFIALAIVVRDLPPFLAMTARHLVAGALLLGLAVAHGGYRLERIGRPQLLAAFVVGGLLFACSHGSLAWAQQTVPAGIAALLVGTIPIWMALLDRVVFGKRLTRSAYVGFVVGFVGLGFLLDPFGSGSVDRLAAIVIVLGALTWAIGSLYARRAPLPSHPLASAGLGSLAGGLVCLAIATGSGELGRASVTPSALLALAYLIVAGSLVGFTAYVWLLKVAPVSLVATYAYVNPIVAVALGWLLLGEAITAQMLVAGAAVVISVALILRSSAASREPGRGLLAGRRAARVTPATQHAR